MLSRAVTIRLLRYVRDMNKNTYSKSRGYKVATVSAEARTSRWKLSLRSLRRIDGGAIVKVVEGFEAAG
jgi:hypothetical protein